MGEFDSTQACTCYQGRYVPYQPNDDFVHEIVNAAGFNGAAILDCYAGDIPKRNSLLADEQAKTLKALRANWFYQKAGTREQEEAMAKMNKAFTPGQNSSSSEQDIPKIIGLAAQRGAGIRRCIGKNKEALEAAYQSAAQASLAFDGRPTQITTPLRTILVEIMAGRLSSGYRAYQPHFMEHVLEAAYGNSLLIRKAYASNPQRRNEA